MADNDKDPVWERILEETSRHASEEPILASFLHATILNHSRLELALSFHLANQLDQRVHDTAAKLLDILGVDETQREFSSLGESGRLTSGSSLPAPSPVFPRYVQPEPEEEGA